MSYPPLNPPYGATLKRPHFTFHEMNGSGWTECPKHQETLDNISDDGKRPINEVDCPICFTEERIVQMLKAKLAETKAVFEKDFAEAGERAKEQTYGFMAAYSTIIDLIEKEK